MFVLISIVLQRFTFLWSKLRVALQGIFVFCFFDWKNLFCALWVSGEPLPQVAGFKCLEGSSSQGKDGA